MLLVECTRLGRRCGGNCHCSTASTMLPVMVCKVLGTGKHAGTGSKVEKSYSSRAKVIVFKMYFRKKCGPTPPS